MALSKKPPARPAAAIPESDVEALINKGGSVPPPPAVPALPVGRTAAKPVLKTSRKPVLKNPASAAVAAPKYVQPAKRELAVLKSGRAPVQLRLEPETIGQIDDLIQTRLVPVSRHIWLMEAIMEKIQRERQVK